MSQIDAGSLVIKLEADDSLLLQQTAQAARKAADLFSQNLQAQRQIAQATKEAAKAQQDFVSLSQKLGNSKQNEVQLEREKLVFAKRQAELNEFNLNNARQDLKVQEAQLRAQTDLYKVQAQAGKVSKDVYLNAQKELSILQSKIALEEQLLKLEKEIEKSGLKSGNPKAAETLKLLQADKIREGIDKAFEIQIKADTEKFELGLKKTKEEADKLENSIKGVSKELHDLESRGKNFSEGIFNQLGAMVANLPLAIAGALTSLGASIASTLIDAFGKAINWFKDQLRSAFQAFRDYEAIEVKVNVATQGNGDASMDFLNKLADKYRVDILTLADSYASLSAAMLGAGKSQEQVNYVFESFVAAGRALNQPKEEIEGILKALEQGFSKGKLQAEELRGQLGDRMPAAVQLMAKALGVTTAELEEMLKKGELTSDALILLAGQVRTTFGDQVGQSLNTASATFDRLSNEVFQFRKELGEAISPAIVGTAEMLGDILDRIASDVFSDLNAAAEGFRNYLEDNPEIVDVISKEVTELLEGGLNLVAEKTKEFIDYLKENPDALNQVFEKVSDISESVSNIAKGFESAFDFASKLYGVAKLLVDTLTKSNPIMLNLIAGAKAAGFLLDAFMPGSATTTSENATGTMASRAYSVDQTYWIDDSPLGSYDFTISQNGNYNVPIPSPVNGQITDVGNDKNGYGNYVEVQDPETGYRWFFAHLESVAVEIGQQVARGASLGLQGRTGRASGEHIHLEIAERGGFQITDRNITEPLANAYVNNLLNNSYGAPTVSPNRVPAQRNPSGNTDISRLALAIVGQESGGDYGIVNPDSGALGLYQIMPENIPGWSREALGREVSVDEFLANPQIQQQIADHKINQYYQEAIARANGDEVVARRMVASAWYSGDMSLWNDSTPQYYGGNSYPSIAEYTASIEDRYQNSSGSSSSYITANPGGNINPVQQDPEEAEKEAEKIKRELRQYQDETLAAQREAEDSTIESQRRERDARLANAQVIFEQHDALQDYSSILSEVTRIQDEAADSTREYDRAIQDQQRELAQLREDSPEFSENDAARQELIKQKEALIAQLQQERDEIQQTADVELDTLNQRIQGNLELAEAQRQASMAAYRLQREGEMAALQSQLDISRIDNPYDRQLAQQEAQLGATENAAKQEIAALAEEQKKWQDALAALGMGAEAVAATLGEDISQAAADAGISLQQYLLNNLADIEEKIENISEKFGIQRDLIIEAMRDVEEARIKAQQAALNSAQDRYATLRGNQLEQEQGVWVANDYRRQEAANRILRDRDASIQAAKDNGSWTPELEAQLNAIAEIDLSNLEDQFKSLGDTIGDVMNSSFKQFFTSLITGSQSAGEAFQNLIGSLLSSLAELAINQIWVDLFGGGGLGSLFGLGGSAAGNPTSLGGMIASAGSLLNGLPGFANGGLVDKPTLAMIGEGAYNEAIVPLPNGRAIPVEMRGAKGGGGNVNSMVNVTINNGGGKNVSNANANALSKDLQQVVDARIAHHKRPGGLLY